MNELRVDTPFVYISSGEAAVSVSRGTWSVGDKLSSVSEAVATYGIAEGCAVDVSIQKTKVNK